ncbi:MAG: HAD family hydrolase [Pseudomonadota bacterium]
MKFSSDNTLARPKAVIFDWDDTIVESWHKTLAALNAALTGMGREAWSDDEARRRVGASARDLFRQLFGDRWEEADKIYYDAFKKLFLKDIRIYAYAEDILALLAGNKVYLAVVSNKRGPLLRSEVEHIRFDRYFCKIVGSGDAEADKPDAAPVHLALKNSGIPAGTDVWFVGDSPMDMTCALNSGCTPVLLETRLHPEELLSGSPPVHRFRKHKDLMEFLKACFT